MPSGAKALGPAHRLTVGTRILEVQGRAATVFGITDAKGRSGLELDVRNGFDVALVNDTSKPTIVYWHGLTPPFAHDGATLSQQPILPGTSQDYRFLVDELLDRPRHPRRRGRVAGPSGPGPPAKSNAPSPQSEGLPG